MRTPNRIGITAIGLALLLGSSALAFDPPRPGSGAAGVIESDAPRPPGSIPRGAAGAIQPVPRPVAPPAAAAAPVVATPATPTPIEPMPRLGPAPIINPPNAPAYAPSGVPQVTPFEAFRSGAQMLRQGQGTNKERGLRSLEYAAERGVVAAQWMLARMYAEGDSVRQSDERAFDYYSRIADAHAEDLPGTQQARFVASAFVELGHYYASGIPNSPVTPDVGRARDLYSHAAVYFGDPEAQYYFGRVLLDGAGGPKDPRRAAQWFYSAANKGQTKAQAMLGRILFKGEPGVPRQPARGLMWLTLAKENAPADRWIADLYGAAFAQASGDERALAGEYLERWISGRRN